MALSPNTDNYSLGKGVVFFDQLVSSVYQGERDLGNAPSFTFNIALETLEHFSSRGGLKAKDKSIISQITPGLAFTLDEVNKENMALLTLGDTTTVTQTAGSVAAEVVTANLDMRSDLDFRGIENWNLTYDTGTVIFVVGEVVTGNAGATGIVLSITGTSTTGTLVIAKTNATLFVTAEAITGDGTGTAGAAVVTTAVPTLSTTPTVLVQDSADTVTYVAGTDYEINTTLSDDSIGRIKFMGSTISESDEIHVTYGHAALTYTNIAAFANTQIIGKLRFVSDNPAGQQQELECWSVSLVPSGDTSMVGEDWSTLGFTGEILKDETNHPLTPYMNIIMDQTLT